MSERSLHRGSVEGPSTTRARRTICQVARAALIAMPVSLVAVVAATRLHLPAMAVPGLAVATAAFTAAIAARWCAERRMRNDVEVHERELAHTKRQILALVSHELRTPVTGVVGFSRTLSGRLDDLDHDTLRLFVDAIDEHANRLARLIDNVVVASRTPLVVVGGTCQLSQVLSKAVARAGMAGEEARLQISMQGALGARIDEEAAIRILANLLDNAVKFGDRDATIYLDGHERDGRVVLRVANAGPAIPLGLRSALYDPFVQSDTTDTRAADGLGLGLHVCRQLVEAYGGSIDLVDHPRLTVFEISLPGAREARIEAHVTAVRRKVTASAPDPVAEPPTTVPDHRPRERVG